MPRLMRVLLGWAFRTADSAMMCEALTQAMCEALAGALTDALTGAIKAAMKAAMILAIAVAFRPAPAGASAAARTYVGCGAERRELRSRNPQRPRLTQNLDV